MPGRSLSMMIMAVIAAAASQFDARAAIGPALLLVAVGFDGVIEKLASINANTTRIK